MENPNTAVFSKKIRIRGKVRASEDVLLKGEIEGTIILPEHHLTIDPGALLAGDAEVKEITVRGEHAGAMKVARRVTLDGTARVLADMKTPSLVVADGAKFKGYVDMTFELPPELGLKLDK